MKVLVAPLFAAVLVIAGLGALPGATSVASAASCPTTYVDSPSCGPSTPASPGATVTVTIGAGISAGPAARIGTKCSVSAVKHGGMFSVTSSAGAVTGGSLHIKLHKVGTPGSKKVKITVPSYSHPIVRKLGKGTWHGTMVYLPAAGSQFQYCGIVFRNLKVKGAKKSKKQATSVKVPTSVSAGLRSDAS